MLFATSLLLQTVPFDININPNEKEGGWGGAERAHVDLNQLKTLFQNFNFYKSCQGSCLYLLLIFPLRILTTALSIGYDITFP